MKSEDIVNHIAGEKELQQISEQTANNVEHTEHEEAHSGPHVALKAEEIITVGGFLIFMKKESIQSNEFVFDKDVDISYLSVDTPLCLL